jgi:hypothetical protein
MYGIHAARFIIRTCARIWRSARDRQYRRPSGPSTKWFTLKKKVFETLKSSRWPERHDCALLTGKGFSTRAIQISSLADSDEPLTVFCVHDADAFGTMIYQTLQEETKARPPADRDHSDWNHGKPPIWA